MILAFWLQAFLGFHREVQKADLTDRQKDELMIFYVS